MKQIILKKQIHYLSYPLYIFSFLFLSFETALKSGAATSYAYLFIPITDIFYWPRFTLFILPSLALILFSTYKRKNDPLLKGVLLFSAPIIVSRNIDIFSAYNLIPNLHQPKQFMNLYYVVSTCSATLWMGIIVLGLIWIFQNEQ